MGLIIFIFNTKQNIFFCEHPCLRCFWWWMKCQQSILKLIVFKKYKGCCVLHHFHGLVWSTLLSPRSARFMTERCKLPKSQQQTAPQSVIWMTALVFIKIYNIFNMQVFRFTGCFWRQEYLIHLLSCVFCYSFT